MKARSGGFSIVEALVALVVLSVGMLGIAALYVESLRAGRSAVYHTQAVNLAADMADRIRANRTNNPNVWRLDAGGTPALVNCQTAN
jgi:type IV pilus modification protein PilV